MVDINLGIRSLRPRSNSSKREGKKDWVSQTRLCIIVIFRQRGKGHFVETRITQLFRLIWEKLFIEFLVNQPIIKRSKPCRQSLSNCYATTLMARAKLKRLRPIVIFVKRK